MGGKAPCSAEVETVMEGARADRVGRDDKGQAGRIQEELKWEFWFFEGILLDDGEEGGPADHE